MTQLTPLEYFTAHAPAEPQEWFEPVMEKAPRIDNPHLKNALDKQLRLTAEWKAEREKQRLLQWPLAWAQEMVKRLGKGETVIKEVQFISSDLMVAYDEYINLLNDEINSLIGIASVHGWKSQNVEQGKECRDRIAQFKASLKL